MRLRIPPLAEWQDRSTALADWIVPAGDAQVGLWRRRMLGIALMLFAVLALLTYSAGLLVALVRSDWKLIGIQTTLYAVVLLLVFARTVPFQLRAGLLAVLPAVLGTTLLLTYGFVTMGFAWWIATPILAMALFGIRMAVTALLTQVMTFVLLGWQLAIGGLSWATATPGITPLQYTGGPSGLLPFWISSSTSSIALAALLSLSIGFLFQGLVDESRARRAAEREVDKQQRLAALGTVASGIAHDFNNALQPIIGDLEVVHRAVGNNPELGALIPQMLTNADRARALVRRTLRFGQPHDEAREVVDLRSVLAEAVRMIRATVPPEIELQLAPVPALRIHVDPAELQQILMELVANATQALPNGGVVHITATQQPITADLAATRLASAREAVSIIVHDNGVGMSEVVQARAFDPFFTTRQGSGAEGLGLATVHAVVAELGGVVHLKSQEGRGTCVNVLLPLTDAPLPQLATGEWPVPSSIDDLMGPILVIDDEPAVLQATGRMLERMGYRSTRIGDPMQVMQDIRRMPQPPAVVITDVAMPGLSGWELADQLHADLPSVPVIVMSGHVDVLQQDLSRHPGVYALLAKPFTSAELGSTVSQVLRAAGACQPTDRGTSPAAAP